MLTKTKRTTKPLYVYFRDDIDTYMTDNLLTEVMIGTGAKVKFCTSWSDLSEAISKAPTTIVFHINMVNKHGGTISELILMLETLIRYTNPDQKPNIGVCIESDTSLATIKELQKHKILGIVPGAKSIGAEHANTAIKALLNSQPHWPKNIIDSLPGNRQKKNNNNSQNPTPRQQEVFNLIATRGLSNKQIARTLNIAESTVKLHVGAIMKLYCVRNRTQLALLKQP
jgi:DNA-binding NarL/FixJ family response regulator